MNVNIIGAVLSTVGILLTIWSIFYALQQSKKLENQQTNEMITLWSHLERNFLLIRNLEKIHFNKDFQGIILDETIKNQVAMAYKGLCDQHVRIIEMIIKKTPNLTIETVCKWHKIGKLKSKWEKNLFINLINLGNENLDNYINSAGINFDFKKSDDIEDKISNVKA